MDSPPLPDFKRRSKESQSLATVTSPKVVSELLTLREACARFPGLYNDRIYAWARDGLVHPVQPNGRILYPEWELRDCVKRHGVTPSKHSGFEYDSIAA